MSGHCLLKICKDVYLQSLIEEEELSFELREEIVYQYDGEPLNMLCISDANYGPEIGCAWYSFDDDMERVSEKFNQRYPDDRIAVYVKNRRQLGCRAATAS